MTEQVPSAIGTVAQEAARLIEDMATMARSSFSGDEEPRPYAAESAQEPGWPADPRAADGAGGSEAGGSETGGHQARSSESRGSTKTDGPSQDACTMCGAEPHETRGEARDGTPSSCRVCPLCKGIALLRSVQPETVDLLADFAMSVAATLRDVAARSRASEPAPSARSAPGGPTDPDRSSVQDIPVDDDSEG